MLPVAPGGASHVRSIRSPPTLAATRPEGRAGLDMGGGSLAAADEVGAPVAVGISGLGVAVAVEVNVGLDVGVLVLV